MARFKWNHRFVKSFQINISQLIITCIYLSNLLYLLIIILGCPFFWVHIYSDSSVVIRQLKCWKGYSGDHQKVCLCHPFHHNFLWSHIKLYTYYSCIVSLNVKCKILMVGLASKYLRVHAFLEIILSWGIFSSLFGLHKIISTISSYLSLHWLLFGHF